jgi:hypothetical protein
MNTHTQKFGPAPEVGRCKVCVVVDIAARVKETCGGRHNL